MHLNLFPDMLVVFPPPFATPTKPERIEIVGERAEYKPKGGKNYKFDVKPTSKRGHPAHPEGRF